MAAKVSTALLIIASIIWVSARQPILDFALVSIAALFAVSLTLWSILKRNRRIFLTSALPWLVLGSFLQIAAYQARKEVGQVLKVLPSITQHCKDPACIAMMASGTPYSVAGTNGFLVESFGASIYVKLFSEARNCRAHEDELLGRARYIQWHCAVGPKQ